MGLKTFITIAGFALFFLFTGSVDNAHAQWRYQDHSTVDGVEIQYRWANSRWFDRNSPLELRLKIKNTNDYHVVVSYVVEFYMGTTMAESSDVTEVCINPKLAKTGRLNGMYYQSSSLSNQQLESDDFHWEIEDLEIERVESCRE